MGGLLWDVAAVDRVGRAVDLDGRAVAEACSKTDVADAVDTATEG